MSIILNNLDSLLIMTLGVYAAMFSFASFTLLYIPILERNRFIKVISKGFTNGTIENLDEIIHIYKGIYKLSADDMTYKIKLGQILKKYLSELIVDTSIDTKKINDIKSKLNSYISKLEMENPHEHLPIETKNLIRDITTLMQNYPDLAVSKLDDLASIISSKENVYKKIEMWNI